MDVKRKFNRLTKSYVIYGKMALLSFVRSCAPTAPDAPGASIIVRDLLRQTAPDRSEVGDCVAPGFFAHVQGAPEIFRKTKIPSCVYEVLQIQIPGGESLHARMGCSFFP